MRSNNDWNLRINLVRTAERLPVLSVDLLSSAGIKPSVRRRIVRVDTDTANAPRPRNRRAKGAKGPIMRRTNTSNKT